MVEVLESIVELARKAGFETELRAAAMLSKAGWRPSQNVYYFDKDENKGRELDICAYKLISHSHDAPHVMIMITLCIEVKRTVEPFVFYSNSTSDHDFGSGYGLLMWHHNIDSNVLSFRDIEKNRPNSKPGRICRSYASLKDGKTQHIQGGILSALKGAVQYRDRCNERFDDTSRDACFFAPIVVVDGPLYECYIDENTMQLTAVEADCLVYMQHYESEKYGQMSHRVDIVTMSAFENYIDKHSSWLENLLKSATINRNKLKKNAPKPIKSKSST